MNIRSNNRKHLGDFSRSGFRKPKIWLFQFAHLWRLFLIFIVLAISSCGGCNGTGTSVWPPTNVEEPPAKIEDIDVYLKLTNSTGAEGLKVYAVNAATYTTCADYKQIAILRKKETVEGFHISPGQQMLITFCTPTDKFCSGCKTIKAFGKSDQVKDIILK